MPRLLLAGGGDAEDSQQLDTLLVQLIAGGSLLYLPIALAFQQRSYESCYHWIRAVFLPARIDSITMWTDVSQKTVADVESFAAIYIGGGNTFKLLNDFRYTGFDHVLLHFIERGGIVYGGSAGAIIFGKDIMTALSLDSNDVGLQDTAGFDLVHGCSVWCHYHERDDPMIMAYIEQYQHPVIALSERTGLFVKDDMMQATGFEPVIVFDRQRRVAFPPTSPVTISES